MNYHGFGKMTTGDIRWNMRKAGITRQQLAAAVGMKDQKLQDILSLQYVPDEYAEILLDAIMDMKKKRKGSILR